jgi:hypothetical protein
MRVPSGNTTTRPPADRIARAVSIACAVGPAAPDRKRSKAQEQAIQRALERLDLGHETHVTAGGDADDERSRKFSWLGATITGPSRGISWLPELFTQNHGSQHGDRQQSNAHERGACREGRSCGRGRHRKKSQPWPGRSRRRWRLATPRWILVDVNRREAGWLRAQTFRSEATHALSAGPDRRAIVRHDGEACVSAPIPALERLDLRELRRVLGRLATAAIRGRG